jgi:hypothetical protein
MKHTEQIKKVIGDNVQWLASLVKWLLVIIAAAIAFYCVYPKYYFDRSGFVRCNKITGKVEMLTKVNTQQEKWRPLGENMQSDIFDQFKGR